MKKILALILAAIMLLTAAVACTNDQSENNDDKNDEVENNGDETPDNGNTDEDNQTGEPVVLPYESALDVMTMVWDAFPADQKFPVAGGDYTNMVMDAPGAFDLTAEGAADSLFGMTWYPTDDFAKIDGAATLMHAMMANNFTCAAYHFTSADDATAMVETLKNALLNAQYMCGQPEKVAIVSVPGNYLIVMFGLGEYCVDIFTSTAVSTIEGATIVADEMIAG